MTTQNPDLSAGPVASVPALGMPQTAHTGRSVNMRLVSTGSEAGCNFWIGLAGRGDQPPANLMDVPEITALLTEAASRGITEQGPLMLSDTLTKPPRYVYLLPPPPSGDFRARTIWIEELVRALEPLAPSAVGIYLSPQLVQKPACHDLLQEMLAGVVRSVPTRDYFLLTADYGTNSVLNVALRLKAELDSDELRLNVFH